MPCHVDVGISRWSQAMVGMELWEVSGVAVGPGLSENPQVFHGVFHGIFQFSPSNIEKVWEKPWKPWLNPYGWWGKDRPSFLVGGKPCSFFPIEAIRCDHGPPKASTKVAEFYAPSQVRSWWEAKHRAVVSFVELSLLLEVEVSRTQWCGRSFRLHNFQVNV